MSILCEYKQIFLNDEWGLIKIIPLNGSDGGKIKKEGFNPLKIILKEKNETIVPNIVTRPSLSSSILEGMGGLMLSTDSNMISLRKV